MGIMSTGDIGEQRIREYPKADGFSTQDAYIISNQSAEVQQISGQQLKDGILEAPGNNTEVVFNNNNSLSASPDFTWDDTLKILAANGQVDIGYTNAFADNFITLNDNAAVTGFQGATLGASNGTDTALMFSGTANSTDVATFCGYLGGTGTATMQMNANAATGDGSLRLRVSDGGIVAPSNNISRLAITPTNTDLRTNNTDIESSVLIQSSSGTLPTVRKRALAAQTANLDQYEDSSGVILNSVKPNGDTGIGTDSPFKKLHVTTTPTGLASIQASNGAVIEHNDNVALSLVTNPNRECDINFIDNALNQPGRIRYDHVDDSLSLWTNQIQRTRIDSDGTWNLLDSGGSVNSSINPTGVLTASGMNISAAPTVDNTNEDILVRNSTTGDVETLDKSSLHQVMRTTFVQNATNLNGVNVPLTFNTANLNTITGSSVAPGQINLPAGLYKVNLQLSLTHTAGQSRPNLAMRLLINGALEFEKSGGNYIRDTQGHVESGDSMDYIFELGAASNISFETTGQTASGGTVIIDAARSIALVEKIG